MSTSEDKWFEVWFDQGEDAVPTWILIVTPDKTNPGLVIVSDPQENYRFVHTGQDRTIRPRAYGFKRMSTVKSMRESSLMMDCHLQRSRRVNQLPVRRVG
jgi:hypothetical protein